MTRRSRTSEELMLLVNYLSLIGIWFAIPSVTLLINRDKRWHLAVSVLALIVVVLLVSYFWQWSVLFPKSANELSPEEDPAI